MIRSLLALALLLTEALAAWGRRADDVVGIEIGGARVDLYGHRD